MKPRRFWGSTYRRSRLDIGQRRYAQLLTRAHLAGLWWADPSATLSLGCGLRPRRAQDAQDGAVEALGSREVRAGDPGVVEPPAEANVAGMPPAAFGSVLFLLVAPGVVGGLVPWLLTGWRSSHPATAIV